ncbi:pyruvate dehydrogenase E1 component subunit alpha, mitochondrial isoform X2 [Spinacia oleracea]|uniref:Pyruvate dehydrogenase E1 component subunit alpha, mitochondrial isoform X2 n=1 Tax=Spinacia oleracea TaxID=3562 RepID=A0ABM3QJG4_SPIOL|nr:pyruvate dehydrogenase E1 component subunit alpha, mitochondrial-like isoform X2 [Spinacia oleracea]
MCPPESCARCTQGYVAHNYDVVLLELHTGRVPVDTKRPQGEGLLLSWERDPIERVRKLLLAQDISVEKDLKLILACRYWKGGQELKDADEAIAKAKIICDSTRVPDNPDRFTNIYMKGYGYS